MRGKYDQNTSCEILKELKTFLNNQLSKRKIEIATYSDSLQPLSATNTPVAVFASPDFTCELGHNSPEADGSH